MSTLPIGASIVLALTVVGIIAIWGRLLMLKRRQRFTPAFWGYMLLGSILFVVAGTASAVSVALPLTSELRGPLSISTTLGLLAALGIMLWGSLRETAKQRPLSM